MDKSIEQLIAERDELYRKGYKQWNDVDKTGFLNSIEHRRLSVFDVRIGDKVTKIHLFKEKKYEPHLEPTLVTFLYWDPSVSNFSGYYTWEGE